MDVAGGSYLEICRDPEWDELFGSGVRASAVVSRLSGEAQLHTYIGEAERPTLESYARSYNFRLLSNTGDETLRFDYLHGLARPLIDPPLHLLEPRHPLQLEAETILRFGMLECDCVSDGARVVYDPQSRYNPRPYHENGSQADTLAVVLNQREGTALTGRGDPAEIARSLIDDHGASVAVVKSGASGALVASKDNAAVRVPAYRTSRVFPIGTGDVFSAVFAYHWADLRKPPIEAADLASAAVGAYSNNPARYLALGEKSCCDLPTIVPAAREGERLSRVYLAGPFFTTSQRWLVSEALVALQNQGVEVFSAFHEIGIGAAEEVVLADLIALDACDAVLALASDFDAGTLFEIGYARSRNLPVVALVENKSDEETKMLKGSHCELVVDFVSAVYRATWAALEHVSGG